MEWKAENNGTASKDHSRPHPPTKVSLLISSVHTAIPRKRIFMNYKVDPRLTFELGPTTISSWTGSTTIVYLIQRVTHVGQRKHRS